MKASRWCLASEFCGFPKLKDFKLVEVDLPELKTNEILVEAIFLSLDPYIRFMSSQLKPGDTLLGEQVAKVVSSRNAAYNVGEVVQGMLGWTTRAVVNPDKCQLNKAFPTDDLPLSLTLSVLGLQGLTAYHGLLTAGELVGGETLFVNSSAGIVGATVGQIAKLKGCRVIGCAGSDEKCRLVEKEFGFDACFNYKTQDVNEALKHHAPQGIDFYYDNVGGSMSDEVIINHMKAKGKVLNCGAISALNATAPSSGASLYFSIISKELRLQGFTVFSYMHLNPIQVLGQLKSWIQRGELKYEESLVSGFHQMPAAFIQLLQGKYAGKVAIKV